MLVVLLGPKGSGKSHIGRVVQRELGVHFFHVEPLWMAYYADCRSAGREPSLEEGVRAVHPRLSEALATHEHVCVETTGASPEILTHLLALRPASEILIVRVNAPLELCLHRIATRDPTHQIPVDTETLEKVYRLSTSVDVGAAITLDNVALSDAEIVLPIAKRLSGRRSGPDGLPSEPGER
jgi:shikimate kinase